MISTRGRYAIRVMLDLAESTGGGYVPMRDVAERQHISLKYLERIVPLLTKNRLIEGVHGKGGGYRLCRNADQYTIGEILLSAEGDLAPVSCLECGAKPCERAPYCRTLPMWEKYYELTKEYFDGITLASLMQSESDRDNSF